MREGEKCVANCYLPKYQRERMWKWDMLPAAQSAKAETKQRRTVRAMIEM